MKTAIITLNSKYIHSSLAPWYLKYAFENYCKDISDIDVLEYTINNDVEWILTKIYSHKPDIAAFSCYIWNINQILKIAENLKKVMPNITIILGGPEVSYTPEDIMRENEFVDFIICGEGEESFKNLLSELNSNFNKRKINNKINNKVNNKVNSKANNDVNKLHELSKWDEIKGLCYRESLSGIYDGIYNQVTDLGIIQSPYTDEMLMSLGNNKIIYYEASRGCPFSCSYCISSTFDGVRYFPMQRVKNEILMLIKKEVKQVKFVDRTFNCNKERAKEIIKFVISNSKKTNFHFEAAGDLFDEEMIKILSDAPEGIIQFEIGIQTTNIKTLSEINRKTDINKVFDNIKKLKLKNNIHIHLDLIAGLPYEDYQSFKQSFDDVYGLEPHKLQLGFLKMLKGSLIRAQSEKHEYKFRQYPPYEILYNKYISFSEISELKGIEEVFERYYNSGRFINTLRFIIKNFYNSPFQFYKELHLYNLKHGYLDKPISAREQYTVILNFFKYIIGNLNLEDAKKSSLKNIINDTLKLDYLSTNNTGNLPEGINRVIESGFKDKCLNFLKDSINIMEYLPEFKGISGNQILKKIRFETFYYDVLSLQNSSLNAYNTYNEEINKKLQKDIVILFDYTSQHKVTGVYRYLAPCQLY